MEVSGKSHASAALTPDKNFRCPMHSRLGELQNFAVSGGKEKTNPCPCQESNSDRPTRSQTLQCLS